ncbi:glycosyltransferase [Escherichia coli]|uniref:Glycosyltransferase n=1 Tax=Escherichia coli TaxID=562 RepID=A0A7B9REZ2_ECOLX|nr:glycosyltransferase [Escherichia coli]EFY9965083.1 glycosyltransferase [Shigella boydii]EFZ0025531.1 glycosyltransferase [Shigella dysenteriae]EFA4797910.1 glycosyltransferase [Escherichia coli]EFD1586510.1 glycosyltransferase [Escherichia coli]
MSVIMSVYSESEKMLRQSIDSVLNQSFRDFEFIIVNDNPERIEIIQLLRYYMEKDNRVKVFSNEINKGLTKSLNIAAKKSNSKYIARMDADDISDITRFDRQLDILEKNDDIDICGSNVKVINVHDNVTGHYRYPERSSKIKGKLFFRDCLCHPATMFRRSFFIEVGGYSEDFKKAQDYELWIKALINDKGIYNIQTPLLYYRMHSENISTKNIDEQHYYSIKAKVLLYSFFMDQQQSLKIIDYIEGQQGNVHIIRVLKFFFVLAGRLNKKINGFSYIYFFFLLVKRLIYIKIIRRAIF